MQTILEKMGTMNFCYELAIIIAYLKRRYHIQKSFRLRQKSDDSACSVFFYGGVSIPVVTQINRIIMDNKKTLPLQETFLYPLFFNSLADDLFAFIVTAYRAYMMRFFQCMALWAFHETRNSQLPICTSLVATGSRTFCLRNRHS